ncbi:MAG: sulfurtransferase TusA family protein [Planctomycetes bacterium]|nr:sulfurtransferase TusA family protein [Planctomycetota bacterium]
MTQGIVDLCGKVCPYPVVEVVRGVDRLRSGETLRCVVDDPLAIKAVPEELEDYPDLSISIAEHAHGWEIIIVKE